MSRREQQKNERRQIIIERAKQLFLAHDVQQVQMQDIATAADIGIATLFRYFPKKEYIIVAVSNAMTDEMTEVVREILQQPIKAYEKLEQVLHYYMSLDDEKHRMAKFFNTFDLYLKMAEKSPELYEAYMAGRKELAKVLLELAKEGQQDGSMRQDVDIPLFVMTAVQNYSFYTFKATLTVHDEALGQLLQPTKQLQLMKDVFLTYIRA